MRVFLQVAMTLYALGRTMAQDILVSSFPLQMPQEKEVTAVAFSADGRFLLAGDKDGNVVKWDLESRSFVLLPKFNGAAIFLTVRRGDTECIAVDELGEVLVIDLVRGMVQSMIGCDGEPAKVAIDGGKRYLAIATNQERIELIDLETGQRFGIIDARDRIDDILFLGFDRFGQQIVAIRRDAGVVSWNPVTLNLLRELVLGGNELHGSHSTIYSAATNRATDVFVVGLEEVTLPKGGIKSGKDLVRSNSVIAFHWNTGIEVKRVQTQSTVEQLALGPGSDHVSLVDWENQQVEILDLRKAKIVRKLPCDFSPNLIGVSDDDSLIVASSREGNLMVWRLEYVETPMPVEFRLPDLSGRISAKGSSEPVLKPEGSMRIAILAFEAFSLPEDIAATCLNKMTTYLAEVDYITLVERSKIEAVLKEQQLRLSALTEARGAQIGKLLNVDNVLFCSIGKLGTTLNLTARVISVETGEVLGGRQVTCEECRDTDIPDAVDLLGALIAGGI